MRERKTTKADRTRAAILEAAQGLFAERGYEGATVRDIAARAEIDPAMVIRYFGGKDALFAQVSAFDLRLPDLSSVPRERIGESLVGHFLAVWEGEARVGGLEVALRSAASNDAAAERIRSIFSDQVVPALSRAGGADVARRAGLVSSMLLGLAYTRYVVRIPAVVSLSSDEIVSTYGRALQNLLSGGLIPAGP